MPTFAMVSHIQRKREALGAVADTARDRHKVGRRAEEPVDEHNRRLGGRQSGPLRNKNNNNGIEHNVKVRTNDKGAALASAPGLGNKAKGMQRDGHFSREPMSEVPRFALA